ncbi:MAG: peptidylprolyl isomerase [Phycisphaerales bacterium]|nr:peptidylprolyl isomerase [Phycisphaerales bacterium]
MDDPNQPRRFEAIYLSVLRFAGMALAIQLSVSAMGQEAPLVGVRDLVAEVRPACVVFNPGDKLLVRFTLINPTRETIEIPLRTPIAAGQVELPYSLVLGTVDAPNLKIRYERDRDTPVRAAADKLVEGPTADRIRLAPGAVIGAQIDLEELHRPARYAGAYFLRWTPFGGDKPEATTEFRVEPRKDAIITTDYGNMRVQLAYDAAPQNVLNFLELVRDRFYDNTEFYKILPGGLMQGGAKRDGPQMRPDGKTISAEFTAAKFDFGTIAMARRQDDPDSASSQFFICLGRQPSLDGQYTIIGHVFGEESLRTLQTLAQTPVDDEGRPTRTVATRSIVLIDAEQGS